ncbi:MAG TPA: hypothetical protein VNE38_06115 [Ktedonobacteraceae bacterium]|nr:hypothetical protein [Ktedonobacteraceae bacterium]
MICPHCGNEISALQLPGGYQLPLIANPRIPDNSFVFVANNAAAANPLPAHTFAPWPLNVVGAATPAGIVTLIKF